MHHVTTTINTSAKIILMIIPLEIHLLLDLTMTSHTLSCSSSETKLQLMHQDYENSLLLAIFLSRNIDERYYNGCSPHNSYEDSNLMKRNTLMTGNFSHMTRDFRYMKKDNESTCSFSFLFVLFVSVYFFLLHSFYPGRYTENYHLFLPVF